MDLAYDTETTGLDVYAGDRMFAFSTVDKDENYMVKRFDRDRDARRQLRRIWTKMSGIVPVMHNAKFDIKMTEAELGMMPWLTADRFHDTYIEARFCYPGHKTYRLKDLAFELANIKKDDEAAVKGYLAQGYDKAPVDLMDEYQRRDVERTILLHLLFWPKIQANPQMSRLYDIERGLILATRKMENRGLMVNFDRTLSMIDWLKGETVKTLDDIERLAGRRVNPNRDKELHWLLFGKLGLPVLKKTATGKPSTKKDEFLNPLRKVHPIIDLLMKFRSYSRGITILQGYIGAADGDGIIHPDLNTWGAITGRESCSNPNLQNVSKEGVLLNPFPIPARRCFRPRPGFVNFHVDFSGIEMRLATWKSREPLLLDIIRKGGDVHEPGTILFYQDRYLTGQPKMKKTLRGAGKNCNFGIIYGAGADEVADILGLTKEQGRDRLAEYRRTFPHLGWLNKNLANEARRDGQVITAFGRVIPVPRDEAFLATNYFIQGTAADMIKVAQVKVDALLERLTGGQVRILLPIHDEIIIEFPRALLPSAREILGKVREVMIEFWDVFDIPFEVEFDLATKDWADKRPFKLAA